MINQTKEYIDIDPKNFPRLLSLELPSEIEYLHIHDYEGKWPSIPEELPRLFPKAKAVNFRVKKLSELPASLGVWQELEALVLDGGSLTVLPQSLLKLEHLQVLTLAGNGKLNLKKSVEVLGQLPHLHTLQLQDHYGKELPDELVNLGTLQTIVFSRDYFKKRDFKQVVGVLKRMPQLKKVVFDLWNLEFSEEILALNHLKEISTKLYGPIAQLPAFWGGFTEAKVNVGRQDLAPFFSAMEGLGFDTETRQYLFACYCQNSSEQERIKPACFHLLAKEKKSLRFFIGGNLKGWTKKALHEVLNGTNFSLVKTVDEADLVVLTTKAPFEEIIQYVQGGKKLQSEGQLKAWLENSQEKWLLEEESPEVYDNVYQLFASNQAENFQLAFQIVEGGGVSKEILSMIAAIALAHPDKKISKEAEKLYIKRASDHLFTTTKSWKGFSLRKSSNTSRKLKQFQVISEIDFPSFVIMHNLIASSNPAIKDVREGELDLKGSGLQELNSLLKHFTHIKSLILDKEKDFNWPSLAKSLPFLSHLKHLSLANCHFEIGEEIKNLTSLDVLDLSYNNVKNPAALAGLKQLKSLKLDGTEINDFAFLRELTNLRELSLGSLKLNKLPGELSALSNLQILNLRFNQLEKVDSVLQPLKGILELDLSNNQFTAIPDVVWQMPLQRLLLRSNKIKVFDFRHYLSKIGDTTFEELRELNLAKNQIKEISFGPLKFPHLLKLDISENGMEEMDPDLLAATIIREFYAHKNHLTSIPDTLQHKSFYQWIKLSDNAITSLPAWLADIKVEYFHLQNNQIIKVHPRFEEERPQYYRLYWEAKGNPFTPPQNPYGGMYWK